MRSHDGRLVQVGLRPEQVTLVPDGQGDIPARIDFIEELGASRLCHLRVEDLPFCVLTAAKPALEEGAPVAVSVPPHVIHLFDAESGRRIATEMASNPSGRRSDAPPRKLQHPYGKGKDGQTDLARIARELGTPDFIALQEVERGSVRNGYQDQPDLLAAFLASHAWVYGPGIDLDASEVGPDGILRRRRSSATWCCRAGRSCRS